MRRRVCSLAAGRGFHETPPPRGPTAGPTRSTGRSTGISADAPFVAIIGAATSPCVALAAGIRRKVRKQAQSRLPRNLRGRMRPVFCGLRSVMIDPVVLVRVRGVARGVRRDGSDQNDAKREDRYRRQSHAVLLNGGREVYHRSLLRFGSDSSIPSDCRRCSQACKLNYSYMN